MENLKFYLNKFSKTRFGPIFGVLSVLVGLIGDSIALLLFSGYNLNYMISVLGSEYSPGAIFFNLGIFLSGIFAMPFFLHINKVLKEEYIEHKYQKLALMIALVTCIIFSLIGIFPSLLNNPLYSDLHGILFLFSMIGAIVYLLLYSLIFLKSKNFNRYISYLGFVVILIYILFLLSWFPIIEWLMTFAIITWIMIISIYLLYKRL